MERKSSAFHYVRCGTSSTFESHVQWNQRQNYNVLLEENVCWRLTSGEITKPFFLNNPFH